VRIQRRRRRCRDGGHQRHDLQPPATPTPAGSGRTTLARAATARPSCPCSRSRASSYNERGKRDFDIIVERRSLDHL
jgi:hypothetical protein